MRARITAKLRVLRCLRQIQEQLGLRLESSRGPVVGLAVDKVELPSAN